MNELALVLEALLLTCSAVMLSSWILDLSLRCQAVSSNHADLWLSLAVTIAPVMPLLGFVPLFGEADLLRKMAWLKKQGISFYMIMTDKYGVGLQIPDSFEVSSSLGMESVILVLLWRSTSLVDLLAPRYGCDRGKLLSTMGFAFAATIAVSFVLGSLALLIQDTCLRPS